MPKSYLGSLFSGGKATLFWCGPNIEVLGFEAEQNLKLIHELLAAGLLEKPTSCKGASIRHQCSKKMVKIRGKLKPNLI